MQRIKTISPSERFIKYVSYMDANIPCKKICSLVLLIAPKDEDIKNKSSNIKYIKKSIPKYKQITEYGKRIIIEADLNYFYYLMEIGREVWIVDNKSVLTKSGKEWIKLLTMQLWCQACEKEVYMFPWIGKLSFNQPQVESAIQILNQEEPGYYSIINKELLNESNEQKIEELMEENELQKKELQDKNKLLQDKDKLLQDKDAKIIELYKELEKYKKSKKNEEDKSLDDICYYGEAKDEDDDEGDDEDYKPEDEEMGDNDDDY